VREAGKDLARQSASMRGLQSKAGAFVASVCVSLAGRVFEQYGMDAGRAVQNGTECPTISLNGYPHPLPYHRRRSKWTEP
jgi:hypothetical protein